MGYFSGSYIRKPRPRKDDSEIVQKLFELHALLNHGGKHWIKGYMSRKVNGEMCHCFLGGIYKVTGRRRAMRFSLENLIERSIHKRTAGMWQSVIGFNDSSYTEWKDIQEIIFNAIVSERENAS